MTKQTISTCANCGDRFQHDASDDRVNCSTECKRLSDPFSINVRDMNFVVLTGDAEEVHPAKSPKQALAKWAEEYVEQIKRYSLGHLVVVKSPQGHILHSVKCYVPFRWAGYHSAANKIRELYYRTHLVA